MSKINFNGKWREELVATSDEDVLVFEMTMGTLHVYFPNEERWISKAPEWAKHKWKEYSEACAQWCKENRIPMSVTNDAYFYEQKLK